MAGPNGIARLLVVGDYVSWGSSISKFQKSTYQLQLESGKKALYDLLETAARAVKIIDEETVPIGIRLPNDWVNFGDQNVVNSFPHGSTRNSKVGS